MKRNVTLRIALASILTGGMASLHAAPLVGGFYFNAYGGFTGPEEGIVPPTPDASFPNPEFTIPNVFDPDISSYQHFGWGTPTDTEHSHLTINEISAAGDPNDPANYNDHINDFITRDDPTGTTMGTLTHHNFPIEEVFGPDMVAVHYHLDLYIDPAKTIPVWSSGPMDFTLGVWETLNDAPCEPPGNPATTECDDRLQYEAGWRVIPVGGSVDDVIGMFDWEGNKYEVSMSGFYDANAELQGTFWSGEGTSNTAFVNAQVRAVPEPGTLATIGLGLLSLSLTSLRRRKLI